MHATSLILLFSSAELAARRYGEAYGAAGSPPVERQVEPLILRSWKGFTDETPALVLLTQHQFCALYRYFRSMWLYTARRAVASLS
ncbi:MAG: hypothetical protein AB7K09_14865 [Planctomycetota bacterium]